MILNSPGQFMGQDMPPPGLSPADQADWARAHAAAVQASKNAAAAEAAGKKQQAAQAAAMERASTIGMYTTNAAPKWYQLHPFLLAGGVAAGVGLVVLAMRPAKTQNFYSRTPRKKK